MNPTRMGYARIPELRDVNEIAVESEAIITVQIVNEGEFDVEALSPL